VINLREPTEPGVNVETEGEAAKVRDAITTKGTEPAFHPLRGRWGAATMWFIKRMTVDWDADHALKEAIDLG
jgi:hypothetical protein